MSPTGLTPVSSRPPRRRGRMLRCLAAVSAPLALAGTALAAPAAPAALATTKPAASHARAVGRTPGHPPPPAPALQPVRLPGLKADSYMVTLITGDRVRLSATAPGRYTISAAAASSPTLRISAQGSPHRVTRLYAMPTSAAALITAGRMDKGLFDVAWLAAHGDRGPGARLTVMLQYGGHPDAAALAREAATLPGASVLATRPASSTAEISVTAGGAAGFWAALTTRDGEPIAAGPAGAYRTASPSLADGITRVWLANHMVSASADMPRRQIGQTEYTVTETVTRTKGDVFECGVLATLCPGGGDMFAVAGATTGNAYPAASIACASAIPCTTWRETYRVPAGVYMLEDAAGNNFYAADAWQNIAMVDPQLTVAGNTAITFNADQARQITISAPRPSSSFAATYEDYRTFPDGTFLADFSVTQYGSQSWWVMPSTQPVTLGTFHLSTAWVLGRTPVTMSVATPERLTLHPMYPNYTGTLPGAVFTRFSGRRVMPLVYAGAGTKQDLSGLDLHGRLALIHIGTAGSGDCGGPGTSGAVQAWQLNNLLQAGAAGVLIDPTNGDGNPLHWCSLPIYPTWWLDHGTPVNIPFAAIPAAEGAALLNLLSRGAVRVDVADSGPTPYVYDLKFYQENQIPGSLHYTVTSQELADVNARYHVGQGDVVAWDDAVIAPDEYLVASTGVGGITVPNDLHEYIGPVSPDLLHERDAGGSGSFDPSHYITAFDIFGRAGRQAEDWYDQPEVPGAATVPADVFRAQPGKWVAPNFLAFCMFCRQGNAFYPVMDLVSGADPGLHTEPYAFAPGSIHLYRGSREIQPTSLNGLVTYRLPAARAWYRLTTAYNSTYTDWRFTSSAPAVNQIPDGTSCLGTFLGISTAPCRPDPLVFLRYNAFTDRANAVTAPGSHQMQVTAYHEAANAPTVTGLKLWTSTDGGASWHPAAVTSHGNGSYTATYQVPALSQTSGTVSIRAQASDAAGDAVYQTIYNAYGLTPAPRG